MVTSEIVTCQTRQEKDYYLKMELKLKKLKLRHTSLTMNDCTYLSFHLYPIKFINDENLIIL